MIQQCFLPCKRPTCCFDNVCKVQVLDWMFQLQGHCLRLCKREARSTETLVWNCILLMLTDNTDVSNQKANRTVGCLQMVKLKPGFGKSDIDIINVDIYWVRTVYAWMVAALVCKHENGNISFEVEAWDINCVAEYPMELLPARKNHSLKDWLEGKCVSCTGESCHDWTQATRKDKVESHCELMVIQ
jgi:hypothetical protein